VTSFKPENLQRSALFTDLYELVMAQAYEAEGMNQIAAFELFFREMPTSRNYAICAGLGDVLDYLENWHFTDEDIDYLKQIPQFSDRFLDRLKHLEFSGDVYAIPEGTAVFANEPLVRVEAPIIEAQIIETLVLNQIHFQTVAATKAARVVTAAAGRPVVDFGSRRAHGLDAAVKVGRASYIAGAAGTSNVLAGKIYGVPVFGTMAHSYIQAHEDELETLEQFSKMYPQTTVIVDTYDTVGGVEKVIQLSERMGGGFQVGAIRLDSGNLTELAKEARHRLDNADLNNVKIFLSGGLDEYKIEALIKQGTPVDGFGVGTRLAVSPDMTDLDVAYKLVEFDGKPRTKLSSHKTIYPGCKQVFRRIENDVMAGDTITRWDETVDGTPLLQQVMKDGQRVGAGRTNLKGARKHAREELKRLPDHLLSLESAEEPYPVRTSDRLKQDFLSLKNSLSAG
jgi:nicotinate phosphoribosyltransferase